MESGQFDRTRRGGQVLQAALSIFFRVAQVFANILFYFVYRGEEERIQPIENLILLDSATTLAQKIRSKKLKSVQVVQAFIDRIGEVNNILNAVVDNRFEDAIEDARKADEYIENSGKTKEELAKELPFLGVPFTTKDCIAIKGLSHTCGLYHRKNKVAEEDANVIALMRKAGAIPLAITNVPELCLWWETYNKVYGRTNNAYDTRRIVGGSSGGEGCLLSAAGSPMGIGSDIGGSVRIPAFFNGVFGHKASTGVGSLKGHIPVPDEEEQRSFLACGPMSRFATDLKPMFKIMAPRHVDILQLDSKVDITKLKFYYMESDGGSPLVSSVEPEIREAIRKIVAYLKRSHDITAEKLELPAFKSSMALWLAKMKPKGEPQMPRELAGENGSFNVCWELLKSLVGMSNHTFPLLCVAFLEIFSYPYGSSQHKYLVAKSDNLKEELSNILGSDGVLIYPTHPTAAPYHVEPIVKPFNVGYTAVFNVLHMPCTHCPMGLNKKGLPIGVQVVASVNNDRLTLAVAEELEKAFGGWVDPSRID